MGFHKPVCSRAAHEAAAMSPGPAAILTSCAPRRWQQLVLLGCTSPGRVSDRQTHLHPTWHLALPHLSEECTPAPGQHWNPGAHAPGRMGWGKGEGLGVLPCDLGLPLAEVQAWDATQPRRAPVHTSHPAAQCGVSG